MSIARKIIELKEQIINETGVLEPQIEITLPSDIYEGLKVDLLLGRDITPTGAFAQDDSFTYYGVRVSKSIFPVEMGFRERILK